MTSTFITTLAVLGFLSVVALLATSVLFIYILSELLGMLNYLRAVTKDLFGLDVGEPGTPPKAAASKPGSFVKMERLWDEEKEGRD